MNVWLITDGEILPTEKNAKKMRTWRLGEALSERGHSVIWWSSNFFHIKKQKVSEGNIDVKINERFTAKLIDSGTYKKNISIRRIIHHRKLAKRFYERALLEKKPDVIVVSLPSLELVEMAIKYGEKFDVPVIVDVRDMWPDVFKDYFNSKLLKFMVEVIARLLYSCAEKSVGKASAIVSMNKDLLEWGLQKCKNVRSGVFYIGYDESVALETKEDKDKKFDLSFIENKTVFSYIGVLGNSYDIESIIEVARRLLNEGDKSCHFLIAGDGPKKDTLIKCAQGLNNVTFLGWVDKIQSRHILQKTDVLLVPNLLVALPNKFFEGLYFGIPLLHCIEGEANQLTEKFNLGVYYKKNDITDLHKGIIYFKNKWLNGEINKCKENITNTYNIMFKSSKIYGDYCNFIEDVLPRNDLG